MRKMTFAQAIEDALDVAMEQNENIMIFGEDVHMLRVNLFARYGKKRVRSTPISESAFLGTAVTAAMSGLIPVVEIMMIDFIAVAFDALLNHAAKIRTFSGGKWNVPMVIRAACGGGYGDGGQHEQTLWGMLAHIPGISIVVPSNPADAGALLLTALDEGGPVVYLEHKLLSDYWLDYLGSGGRETISFDVPEQGAWGNVPDTWEPIPFGKAQIVRTGSDLTMVSLGVGVHRAIEAADILQEEHAIESQIIDLRTVAPLDMQTICESVKKTHKLLIIDEDYKTFGLSGEIATQVVENKIPFDFGRVCTENTIPFARPLEDEMLPNVSRILQCSKELLEL